MNDNERWERQLKENARDTREICICPDGSAWMAIQGELYEDTKKCGFGDTASEAFADWIKQHGEPENPYAEQ